MDIADTTVVTAICCVNAMLTVSISTGLSAKGIRFLDHYTPFDYFPRRSLHATL